MNKTSETITGTMSNYGFTVPTSGCDDEDRLVGWNRADSNLDQSWDLSFVGDWDSFTENSTTQNRTHGDAHEILTAASQSVTHDTKGNQTGLPSNLTTSTSGLTLEWDFENKLHAADVDGTPGADILQKFDALGRRISRDDGTPTTVYVPSGQQTIADYTAGTAPSSTTYRYAYASYIDEPVMRAGSASTTRLYYHRNQQYSVTALTDTTATISERYAYDAYGKLTVLDGGGTALSGSAYGNRYTYTGREWDGELGLYHYRARMYDPVAGRFCSRDPIGYVSGDLCLFGYTNGAPTRYTDPQGLQVVAPRKNDDRGKPYKHPMGNWQTLHTARIDAGCCKGTVSVNFGFKLGTVKRRGGKDELVPRRTMHGIVHAEFKTTDGSLGDGCECHFAQYFHLHVKYRNGIPAPIDVGLDENILVDPNVDYQDGGTEDIPWYDDGSLSNSTDDEISIFDDPELPGYILNENRNVISASLHFKDYLVCNGKVVYMFRWQRSCVPDGEGGNNCNTTFGGGGSTTGELPVGAPVW